MPGVMGQSEPLPGVSYHGTMQSSDIYPAVLGIGGVRTQDYTIPVFAEGVVTAHQENQATAAVPASLFNTGAGWLLILLVALAAVVLYHGAG